ncbi:MAG: hypothetical protein SOY27_04280 [Fournierella sp.]|uniref:hypothetical protein n=1 Tax=Allofournierella sp. TaxID=1940256 RepID=UPI002A82F3D8|nr:hypothetical protein [Fournierella sp.]MDY4166692.1 hypothetical protein [Fournierella sp.]
MKLAAKLTFAILLLLALLLNLGAAWLIGSGFSAQLRAAAQQNAAAHRAECYQLQKEMIENPDLETQPPLVTRYGQQRIAQTGEGLAILSKEGASSILVPEWKTAGSRCCGQWMQERTK